MSFIFQTKINIYRPTASTLELVNVQEFPTAVQSASLYIQDDSIALLAISESAGTLMTHILELHLTFQPAAASHRRLPRHPLLECFSNLEVNIKDRGQMVQNIVNQRRNLLLKGTRGQFLGKIIVKKVSSGLMICHPLSIVNFIHTLFVSVGSEQCSSSSTHIN